VQHQEAITVIRRLSPQLTKEAAESVLLRYAEDEDLAPAQLEKLAQAYNMTRQLSHIDASEDRGSTCHQIDTKDLVKQYVSDVSKAASAPLIKEVATHHAAEVDLMRELRREIDPPLTKAADCGCEMSDGISTTVAAAPAPDPEADVCYTVAQLKEAAWEAKVDLYMVADDILKMAKCEGRTLQLSQAELDASRCVNQLAVSESLNWLSKYAAAQKISREISRHEGPVKAAAFNMTTPLSEKVVELAEAFTVTSLFHKVAAEAGIRLGDMPQSGALVDPNAAALDQVAAMLQQVEPEEQVEEKTRTFNPPPEEVPTKSEPEASTTPGGGKGGAGGGKSKPAVGGDKGTQAGKGNWLAAIISGATKPVNAAAGAVDAAAKGAVGAVRDVTGKERVNKNQVKLDGDIMDIRRSILIRRLAASDPVLKDMPIKDVLDTYNAIAESNPEAAANPRRVLLAMREAASYEGITLDSQKLLGDVRGASAKTDAAEADNTRRRYTA
jgi:hypothetical protein